MRVGIHGVLHAPVTPMPDEWFSFLAVPRQEQTPSCWHRRLLRSSDLLRSTVRAAATAATVSALAAVANDAVAVLVAAEAAVEVYGSCPKVRADTVNSLSVLVAKRLLT